LKQLKIRNLLLLAVGSGILGAFYGMLLVSRGFALPIARQTTLVTMPVIGALLFLISVPVIRHRRLTAEYQKALAEGKAAGLLRPKPLDPFYAVRVLLLAKSAAIASAVFAGFQAGLVVLQLFSPVVAPSVWLNVGAVIGSIFSLVIGVMIERFCRVRDDSGGGSAPTGGAAA